MLLQVLYVALLEKLMSMRLRGRAREQSMVQIVAMVTAEGAALWTS